MERKEFLDTVEKAMHGDKKAFAAICEEKARDIIYVTGYLLDNEQDREDAAQDIILYMQEHIVELKSAEAFHTWMYRIIKGKCANMRRNSKRRMYFLQTRVRKNERRNDFVPQEFLEDAEKRKVLIKIVKELPVRNRMCILMFYYQGMKYDEIAEALQISKKDVDNALVKSRKQIRKKLEKEYRIKNAFYDIKGLVPVPFLAQVLHKEMQETVVASAVHELTAVVGSQSIMSEEITAGNHTSPLLKNNKLWAVTAAVAGIAIGAGFLLARNDNEEHNPLSFEAEPEVTLTPMEAAEEEGDYDIKTLEDMIGIPEAEQLRSYAVSEHVDIGRLKEFLKELGLKLQESLWDPIYEERDSMYVIQKQNKQLLVFIRVGGMENASNVVFRFSDIGEGIPEDIEISITYDNLRRAGNYEER